MDFEKSIQPFLNLFYYLGQSPFQQKNPIEKRRFQISKNLFLLAHGILSGMLTISIIYYLNFRESDWSRTDRVLIILIALCEAVRIASVLIQCIFSKNHLASVNSTFRMLERFYAIHLGHSISYRAFRRQYKIKATALCIVFIPQFVIFLRKTAVHGMTLAMQVKFMQIIKLVSILHNIFYIDLLNFYFAELNAVIRKDLTNNIVGKNVSYVSKSTPNLLICEKLRCYKTVHFHMWTMAQQISDFFGWSLVATILYIFVELVHATYFFILRIHPPWIVLHIICESFSILKSDLHR